MPKPLDTSERCSIRLLDTSTDIRFHGYIILTICGHLSCIIRHWIDLTVGGRGPVCLFHLVLGDYIIHNEMHMGSNVLYLGDREIVCLSHVVLGDYIITRYIWEGM